MTILKVATAGTTVYFVDTDERKFLRVKGNDSLADLWYDGSWNKFTNTPTIEIGSSMYFDLARPFGAYQLTTPVSAVEEVDEKSLPTPNPNPKEPSRLTGSF